MMNLDEAIAHAQEKAQEDSCCGREHAQLANWLLELRELRQKALEKDAATTTKPVTE